MLTLILRRMPGWKSECSLSTFTFHYMLLECCLLLFEHCGLLDQFLYISFQVTKPLPEVGDEYILSRQC